MESATGNCKVFNFKRSALAASIAIALMQSGQATNTPITWDGDTSTDWADTNNWVGGVVPPADDHAKITGTFANQPTLSGATSVGAVWLTALGQTVGAVANDNILTINGNTVDSVSNVAILFNNSTGFDATIAHKVSINAADLVVRNDTDSSIFFSSATNAVGNPVINLNANTLTLSTNGAGNITTGNIGGTGGITINSTGTGAVISNSNNTNFSGQLTIANGIFQTNGVNNTSSNGKVGNSALSVILGSAGKTGTLRYNGATASSTKKFTLATDGIGVLDMQPTAAATLTVSGVIDGAGKLRVAGNANGTLLLSGANTYSGGTELVSGKLTLGVNTVGTITSGPVGTGTLTLAGGTLNTNGTRSIANPISTNGTTILNGTTSAMTFTGSVSSVVQNNTNTDVLQGGNNTGAVTFSGDFSNFWGKIAQDTVGGTSINFSSQDINLQNGKLAMSGTNSAGGRTVRNGDGVGTGVATFKIGELSGTGVINPQTSSSGQNYEIGARNTDALFGGVLHGRTNRPVNVTKVGTGSLTMTGVNYYTGGSNTVSAGTLIAGGDVISSTTMDGTNLSLTITGNVFSQVGHGLADGDRVAFTNASGALVTITQYYVVNAAADTFQVSTTLAGTPLTGITDAIAGVTAGMQAGVFGGGANAILIGDANTGANNANLLTGGAFTIERAVKVTNNGTGTAGIGGLSTGNSTFAGSVAFERSFTVGQNTDGGILNVTGGLSGANANAKTITFGSATVVPTFAPNGFLGNVNVGSAITEAGGGVVGVNVAGGNVTFGGANTYTGNTTVSGGILNVASTGSITSPTGNLSVGSGAFVLGGSASVQNTANTAGIGTIHVQSTGTLTANNLLADFATIDGTATVRTNGGAAGASKIETLNIGAAGKINLKDNDLVVGTAADVSAVRAAIKTGVAGSIGITSDLPAFGITTGFGYALGNDTAISPLLAGSLSGQSYDANSVLVKYTFLGDADLDGDSDLNDLGLWAQSFTGDLGNPAIPATYWTSGDFDYDGDSDLNDLGFWAGTFTGDLGGGAGSLIVVAPGAPAGAISALNSMGITVVPEPSTFVLAGVGLAGLAIATRRRKK